MSVFRNLDCLSLVICSSTTLLKLQAVLFVFFFQILRFEIGGAAYLWMRLIHGRLRYISNSDFQIQIFKCSNSKQAFLCRFLLQNVFLKLINIFVFFVFILVDALFGSIKTKKSQKSFLPQQKIILPKENSCAPA